MRHALNMALQGFEGAMVLVSHDRFLLTSVCEDFYLVDSGQVEPFNGDLEDYRSWILSQQNEEKAAKQQTDKPKVDRKAEKRREAEFRQSVAPLKKAIEKHEKAMEATSAKLSDVETSLSDTTLYEEQNKVRLMALLDEQTTLKQAMEEHEMAWLDAQEAMEAAKATYESEY